MTNINQTPFQESKNQTSHSLYSSFSSRCLSVESNSDFSATNPHFGHPTSKQNRNRNKESPNEPQPNDSSGGLRNHSRQRSITPCHNYAWAGNNPTTTLNALPAEIVLLIFSFLGGEEVHRVSQVGTSCIS
ncbi:hypothetical protein K493DRAFT_43175 [Basidiobolus meristosporus CBS 931.73]|uniref:F-box domain-containing protein n=1 Tax=Basidiobolus meristosporus CBS 931.73 TaxID=1314790 RepID=A0A1Y1Y3F3_9FUNG|nr:hypothetical protein K493DRAFT_43175 [Basidiobolus meristosporus CBS 931.73]|eukprot:ORX92509.1 hypothetical protein K493DRAFT_43175 [Basidiobolus meristosporus CBS 931.73]